jgi:trk system potassium uptake protein TrkA
MGVREQISRWFGRTPRGKTARADRGEAREAEYAVIGLGVFGRNLALRLSDLGCTVLGIDSDAAVIQTVAGELSSSLVMDSTNEEALREADIESYGTVIVSIGGDHFEAAALTTIALAKIGVPRIVALASSQRQLEILQAIGASQVLNPVEQGALTLADELTDPGRGASWPISSDHQVALVPVPAELVGRPIGACKEFGVTPLLLSRSADATPNPDPASVLQADDLLVVEGSPLKVLDFRRLD